VTVDATDDADDQIVGFCNEQCWAEKQEKGEYPGNGGFLPYGFSGVIAGTATCFYAFVGFDAIATTGEEAINPQRNIPISIVLSLIVCCVAYLGISASLTLMVPYYLLDKQAPLPAAFSYVGIEWASYVVGIGATCALTTSLLGAMFPMPRVIYAMAEDGILYRKLAEVHAKTQTPIVATVVSGTLAAVLALIFDLKELVDFMSIGTLMAYTLVAASVMILRYRASDDDVPEPISDEPLSFQDFFKPRSNSPNQISTKVVTYNSALLTVACVAFSAVGVTEEIHGFNKSAWAGLIVSAFVIMICTLSIRAQPESSSVLDFKVPMIPFIPVVNILVNVYLMVALPWSIWLKLLVWLGVGYFIYFTYGIHNSTEGDKNGNKATKLGLQ
jgi:cationic amino acid transporter 1